MRTVEFRGMVNQGYVVKVELVNSQFSLLSSLVEDGYFREAQTRPIVMTFQLSSGSGATYPQSATKLQKAIIVSVHGSGSVRSGDTDTLTFIAIDPASWFLQMGDCNGGAIRGNIEAVLRTVMQTYAPKIEADIGKSIDSPHNTWWPMRQSPKGFIWSLLEWSSSLTPSRTNWMSMVDGYKLALKEQAAFESRPRAYYRVFVGNNQDTVVAWELMMDNALSLMQTKLVTHGVSATAGAYLDRTTDKNEEFVFVKDSRTTTKVIPKMRPDDSYTKPPEGKPQTVGWTSINSVPEVYSGGELGVDYSQYVDGRARRHWLNLNQGLIKLKLTVVGHGEWSDTFGLGVDTAFVRWQHSKTYAPDGDPWYWVTGTWLVYGFHHRMNMGMWHTDLYLARCAHDSSGKRVGGELVGPAINE